jgi:hypothetical protein
MFKNVRRERFLKILVDTGSVTATVALYEPREGSGKASLIKHLVRMDSKSRWDPRQYATLQCGDRGKPWITV